MRIFDYQSCHSTDQSALHYYFFASRHQEESLDLAQDLLDWNEEILVCVAFVQGELGEDLVLDLQEEGYPVLGLEQEPELEFRQQQTGEVLNLQEFFLEPEGEGQLVMTGLAQGLFVVTPVELDLELAAQALNSGDEVLSQLLDILADAS